MWAGSALGAAQIFARAGIDGDLVALVDEPVSYTHLDVYKRQVAQGVQQDVVALVAAVGFVAEEHGRPLHIGHGRRAGIGEHVHRQHACGEGKFIVVRGLEGAFALRGGDAGDVPRDISKGARGSNCLLYTSRCV